MTQFPLRIHHADNERILLGQHLARTAARRPAAARAAPAEAWIVEPGSTLPAWGIAGVTAAMAALLWMA